MIGATDAMVVRDSFSRSVGEGIAVVECDFKDCTRVLILSGSEQK